MKERGIIFSAPMVRALLADEKTQTRRVIKNAPAQALLALPSQPHSRPGRLEALFFAGLSAESEGLGSIRCPYGVPVDRLYVKESFLLDPSCDDDAWWTGAEIGYGEWSGMGRPASLLPKSLRLPENVLYAATWDGSPPPWSSPIYMARWASRITLEITDVEPQRLMEITDADAWAEGVRPEAGEAFEYEGQGRNLFLKAWQRLHGEESVWENPWVWKISFKRAEEQRCAVQKQHTFTRATEATTQP